MAMKLQAGQRWKYSLNSALDSKLHKVMSYENEQVFESFIDVAVSLMGAFFSTPEEEIITHGDKSLCMFFIVRGNLVTKFPHMIKDEY